MRLCRFRFAGQNDWGLYDEQQILACGSLMARELDASLATGFEAALPMDSALWSRMIERLRQIASTSPDSCPYVATAEVELLPPIATPPKLLLLAGNYAEHVREQGGTSAEKERTYPYVFMKPPSTTMIGSGATFQIPDYSALKLDHEVELGVIIGQRISRATAEQARTCIVGYTVINDISNRGFRPNPQREVRPRDTFFDWQHGKWHDGSCPIGPCILLADDLTDPHALELTLAIDGDVRQRGSTSQMIFSIYELIEFISSFMTLEAGDIISTGTPSGVGNATGRYLQTGTTMVAAVEAIGQVLTRVE